MTIGRCVLLASLVSMMALAVSCGGGDDGDDEEDDANPLIQALEGYMQDAESGGFSGSVLVADGDEILVKKGYGLCIRETDTPCTPQTVFDIGSITKHFTASAVMALKEMGLLALTDPLSDFFPDVPADKAAINLQQLLTHTAGFAEFLGDDYDPVDRDTFVELAFSTPLDVPPGTLHIYSNVGYSLLGIIIELVTGASYEDALAGNLFDPAGLLYTGYLLPDWSQTEVAHGYLSDESWGSPLDHPWDSDGPYWNLRANGGLLSTVEEMYAWRNALLGGAVLSPSSIEEMFTQHVEEEPGSGSFYGYGIVVVETSFGKLVWHNGGNGYFFADFWMFPDSDLTLVVTCNAYSAYPDVEVMAQDLAEIVLTFDAET